MSSFSMDKVVVLSDWPDDGLNSAMDVLHGSNPWMPAYGFHHQDGQQPPLLEKEDFLDSADAELFLHNTSLAGQHYLYLETIQEETSDDLQSESDRSGSRASVQGWLATDSESGSVIRICVLEEPCDSGSEREIACPAKRRRQDFNHLTISDDESSLSRSSSLLQFECLEKQCQDISSSSPSIFSNFSYDSLENQRNKNVSSPDSLEHNSNTEQDQSCSSSYYKMLKIDLPTKRGGGKQCVRLSPDSSESADSDETLETPQYDSCKSVNNLKTWRSFDCLNANASNHGNNSAAQKTKMSTENLSEDSGYSDNFCNGMKCNSIPNVLSDKDVTITSSKGLFKTRVNIQQQIRKNSNSPSSYVGFDAYDGDVHPNFTTNFGVSYQDLTSAVDKYDIATEYRSPLIDRFMKRHQTPVDVLNIDARIMECAPRSCLTPKITSATFASVPNLHQQLSSRPQHSANEDAATISSTSQCYFEESVCVSSVPSDLNLAADLRECVVNKWGFIDTVSTTASIAEKNCDIGDLCTPDMPKQKPNKPVGDKIVIKLKHDSSSVSSASDLEAASFIRESSYLEAMANSIEMSDNEQRSKMAQRTKPKTTTTLAEFDQKILKAISETSINSNFTNSTDKLQSIFASSTPISTQPKRNVISTPDLSSYDSIKSNSIEHSTSTSGMSTTEEEKLLLVPTKSFSGSTGSKGVHFSPVVSEVNWRRDDSESTIERESSYSLSSTPERELNLKSPQRPAPPRMSASQPELLKVKKLRKMNAQQPIELGLLRRDYDENGADLDDSDEELLQATKNYVVKRYLSCGDGDTLYNNSKRSPTQELQHQQKQERCDANNRRAPAANAIGSCTSVDASYAMDRKKDDKKKKKDKEKQTTVQKIGELWNKFSHFRFSSSRGAKSDAKLPQQRKTPAVQNNETTKSSLVVSPTGQRYATKEDYVYIPLRGTAPAAHQSPGQTPKQTLRHSARLSANNNNLEGFLDSLLSESGGGVSVSGKPPLPQPKLPPPRVIGLCMKANVQSRAANDSGGIDPVRQQKPPRQQQRPPPGHHQHQQQHNTTTTTATTATLVTSCSSTPMGLIETDLDTEVTVITSGVNGKTRSLMNLGATTAGSSKSLLRAHHHHNHCNDDDDDDSIKGLGGADDRVATSADNSRPHKSMEFLLDKQNLQIVEPPENNLQKNGSAGPAMLSEHELRVQRSYNRLNVPDWFKRFQQQRQSCEGLILPRNNKTTNSTSALHSPREQQQRDRWPPLAPTTTSFNNLAVAPPPPPHSSNDDQQFVRWLKQGASAASSPCQSTRSSFNMPRYPYTSPSPSLRSSFNGGRTPYMGWRSQDKLNRTPRTPAERLANSILLAQDATASAAAVEDIIEVTAAIDQFVHDSGLLQTTNKVILRSRSVSPAPRKCWMESSFVGTKPLDSPQTPLQQTADEPHHELNNDGQQLMLTGLTLTREHLVASHRPVLPSPDSATLEDVLDSLLGLPSMSRASSPRLGLPAPTGSANNDLDAPRTITPPFEQRQHRSLSRDTEPRYHRLLASEGDEQSKPAVIRQILPCNGAPDAAEDTVRRRSGALVDTDEECTATSRRVSFEDDVKEEHRPTVLQEGRILLTCSNLGCPRTAFPSSSEGREFKQCHNCDTGYCSRQCRRDSWDAHRITCDTVRVQNIIRMLIASMRRLPKVMDTLSDEARRGFISRGPGTVKMYFDSIGRAEEFLRHGAAALGKFDYIAWTGLMPGELDASLYAALVDLCRNYNPENRFILYIVVCVETEIQTTSSGTPRIERRVVGNYVKLRLTGLVEIQPLRGGSPYRRLTSTQPTQQPLTLILKAAPLPRCMDRARIFDKISNILCGRGISLRRQEPNHYAALQHYISAGEGGPYSSPETVIRSPLRYDSITIYARKPIVAQPDIYIIMLDASNEVVDRVLRTSGLRVLVFDLVNDTDETLQMLLGLAEAVELVADNLGEEAGGRRESDDSGMDVTVLQEENVTGEAEPGGQHG